jgi:sarcosine oxidase, subunit delta
VLRIPCPHCGLRDEPEFSFGGPACVVRPGPDCDDAQWSEYLFNRENPAGVHFERWCHSYGCGRWLNIERDTTTHRIIMVYLMDDARPDHGRSRVRRV